MAVKQQNFSPQGARDQRLYLTEAALDQAAEAFLAASRALWRTAEEALADQALGPAHYRALSAIRRHPAITPTQLRGSLGVRKQSLARVLKDLTGRGLIARARGASDRRERPLALTPAGEAAETAASAALRARLAIAFRAAGAGAVAGARLVFEEIAQACDAGEKEDAV